MSKGAAMFLIALGWALSNVHRCFSTNDYIPLHPFLNDVEIDRQWLLKDLGEMIFYSVIVFVAFSNAKSSLKKFFLGLFIAQVLEIVNYTLFFKRNQELLCVEGLIILFAIILSIRKWNFSR